MSAWLTEPTCIQWCFSLVKWPKDQLYHMEVTKEFAKNENVESVGVRREGECDPDTLNNFVALANQTLAAEQRLPPGEPSVPITSASVSSPQNRLPMTPVQTPEMTPGSGYPAGREIPTTPISASASPHMASPMGSPQASIVNDPEYVKSVTTLIQNINTCHVQWARKSNEYTLILTKSKSNPNTKDSPLETALARLLKEADEQNVALRTVEEKFVLNQLITPDEQIRSKQVIANIVKKIKDAQKIKVSIEGHFKLCWPLVCSFERVY